MREPKKRTKKITLLLTELEKKEIKKKAEKIGLDVNNYIRYKLFN